MKSVVLEIPQTELDYGDQELPTVIEGSPRLIGPLASQLDVHIAGKASITYRRPQDEPARHDRLESGGDRPGVDVGCSPKRRGVV